MTLTAGDIDVLKHVNPGTLRIHKRCNEVEGRDELVLTCIRIKDAQKEDFQALIVLETGTDFDNVLRAVIDHQLCAHEPRGHTSDAVRSHEHKYHPVPKEH